MRQSDFISLEKAISQNRLSTYARIGSSDKDEQIKNYIYNAKISENFYFLFQNPSI